MKKRIATRIGRFETSEEGSATVEACLWIPVFLFLFMLILDTATVFSNNTNIERVAQDGARQYVKGAFDGNTASLDAWIEAELAASVPNADAVSSISPAGVLTTQVSYPASDTDLSGATGLRLLTMRVQVIKLTEL